MASNPQPLILTAVIFDGSPVHYLNEPCSHRTVHLLLTASQCEALQLGEDEGYGQVYVELIQNAEVRNAR